MAKSQTTTTKTRKLIEELDLRKKKEAARVMNRIRRKHKVKAGEKSSTEVIRYFRDTRYNQ